MKKLIVTILVFITVTIARAEIPKNINVYTGYPAFLSVCKSLFEEYDKTYYSNSQIIVKPGAAGMVAIKAMQLDQSFSVLCGTGVAEHAINKKSYTGSDISFEDLKTVGILATFGINFITNNSNKFNTLQNVLQQTKPITIGYHSAGVKTVVSEIVKNHNIIWVPYKSSMEAVASLVDGTLDIYPDSAGLLPLVASGTLKSLGSINTSNSYSNIDLGKDYPAAAELKLVIGISTSAKISIEDRLELEKRIKYIHSFSRTKETINAINYKHEYISAKNAEMIFQLFENKYVK